VDGETLTYDPKKHWIKRGETYEEELNSRRKGKTARNFDAQERFLPSSISALVPERVLEVGCGYGRMTALVSKIASVKKYDAVDLSPHNIEVASERIEGVHFMAGDFMELNFENRYDVVFACEVLMHVLPDQIEGFVKKMKVLSNRYVVSLDYSVEQEPKELDPTNFNHDYRDIYRNLSVTTLEEKRLESKRFFGTEAYPQILYIADFRLKQGATR
jgi:SAM-dependent methyltransferase